MNCASLLPTYFISHGGGPWPYMQGESRRKYSQLESSLADIPKQIDKTPDAILMISAHWESQEFAIMSSPKPRMLYDYGGFPEHTYKVQYPAPGSPLLAQQIQTLLKTAEISSHIDEHRGYDHGAFSPLAIIYPDANVPVIQLSLQADLDPFIHIKLGQALTPLRKQGVLIIGSGLSYHNLQNFGSAAKDSSASFDHWLQASLCPLHGKPRVDRLINWEQAPAARLSHPREEHLLSLMVAVGAGYNEPGKCIYHEENFMGGISVSSFRFGR